MLAKLLQLSQKWRIKINRSYWHDGTLKGGVDPQGPAKGSSRVVRGGSWVDSAQYLSSGSHFHLSPSVRGHDGIFTF